jgi:hypothetical protein
LQTAVAHAVGFTVGSLPGVPPKYRSCTVHVITLIEQVPLASEMCGKT